MVLTKKSEKEIAPAHQWSNPFEQMDDWFHDMMTQNWMHPFSRRHLMEWPKFESAFQGRALKVDVIDKDKELLVRAELPGVSKDNIDITLSDQYLTIKAHTEHEEKEAKDEYYRHEISKGEFQRTLLLPEKVNEDKARATFKDGVMELVLPKSEATKRRSIKVE